MGYKGLMWDQWSKNLKCEQGEKLDYHVKVKFHGKSNGDSFDALKLCLDPKILKNLTFGLGEK